MGSVGANWFSPTKHIDQLLNCFDKWESQAAIIMLGEAVLLFQEKAERFIEINRVVF